MKMLITRKAEFSASHRCYNPKMSEEDNHTLYGELATSHGHGHNYELQVTIAGGQSDSSLNVPELERIHYRYSTGEHGDDE